MSYSNTVSRYRVTGNLIVNRGVVFASTRVSTAVYWQQIEIPPLPNRAFQNPETPDLLGTEPIATHLQVSTQSSQTQTNSSIHIQTRTYIDPIMSEYFDTTGKMYTSENEQARKSEFAKRKSLFEKNEHVMRTKTHEMGIYFSAKDLNVDVKAEEPRKLSVACETKGRANSENSTRPPLSPKPELEVLPQRVTNRLSVSDSSTTKTSHKSTGNDEFNYLKQKSDEFNAGTLVLTQKLSDGNSLLMRKDSSTGKVKSVEESTVLVNQLSMGSGGNSNGSRSKSSSESRRERSNSRNRNLTDNDQVFVSTRHRNVSNDKKELMKEINNKCADSKPPSGNYPSKISMPVISQLDKTSASFQRTSLSGSASKPRTSRGSWGEGSENCVFLCMIIFARFPNIGPSNPFPLLIGSMALTAMIQKSLNL